MAAPNLLAASTVTGKTAVVNLTTATSNIITASSNTVSKIESVILTNSTGNATSANIFINRSSTAYYLGGTVSIPANSVLVLIGKDSSFYLEEGDVIQANASANSAVAMTAGYELIAS
jgi:hypothetical protein